MDPDGLEGGRGDTAGDAVVDLELMLVDGLKSAKDQGPGVDEMIGALQVRIGCCCIRHYK